MPRKPNYKFERLERERQKAAKKTARREAKKEKAENKRLDNEGPVPDGEESSESPVETPGQPEENGEPDR